MTGMTRNQNFIVRFALNAKFTISQTTGLQCRIDTNLVLLVRQILQLSVAQTKPPGFFVVRSAIGDPVGRIRQSKQVFPQLNEPNLLAHRNAVVHDVEIAFLEIDDSFTLRVPEVGVTDVPLLRHNPIEDLGPAGNFPQGPRSSIGLCRRSGTSVTPTSGTRRVKKSSISRNAISTS